MQEPNVDTYDKIKDYDRLVKMLGTIDVGDDKKCVRVLVTKNGFTGETGVGAAGVGIIISPDLPQFGGYLNAPSLLAHECGHFFDYKCGDEPNDKTHSKAPNIMQTSIPSNDKTKELNPDPCWCRTIAGEK